MKENNKFFRQDIIDHKRKVFKNLNTFSQDIMNRAFEHDNDKIEDDNVFKTYYEHSEKQKELPFGSPKKKAYEDQFMREAIDLHIQQNKHHFFHPKNETTFEEATFMDYLEVIADWEAAMSRSEKTIEEQIQLVKDLMEKYKFPYSVRAIMINTYLELKTKAEKQWFKNL